MAAVRFPERQGALWGYRRAYGRAGNGDLTMRERPRHIKVILSFDSLRADVVVAWRRLGKNKVTSTAASYRLPLASVPALQHSSW